MKTPRATRFAQGLGDVDANLADRGAPAHADAGAFFERVGEIVQRVTFVEENRGLPFATQRVFVLNATDQ